MNLVIEILQLNGSVSSKDLLNICAMKLILESISLANPMLNIPCWPPASSAFHVSAWVRSLRPERFADMSWKCARVFSEFSPFQKTDQSMVWALPRPADPPRDHRQHHPGRMFSAAEHLKFSLLVVTKDATLMSLHHY